MMASPLESEATPAQLRTLAQLGVLTGAQLERALTRVDARADRRSWQLFAERALLFVGLGLVVAAVVFFFAANWGVLGRAERLGLALSAHLIAALAAARLGTGSVAGRAAAAGAALLVGPALLTYGQAYQTGADAWQLFLLWTALAVPFAVVVRGTALWAVVLLLFRIAAFLFVDQVASGGDTGPLYLAFLATLVVDTAAYVAARRRASPSSFLPLVVATLALVTVAPGLAIAVLDLRDTSLWGWALWAAALAAHAWGFGDAVRLRDMPRTALLCLSAALHIGIVAARVTFDALDLDEAGLLVMCVVVLAEGSAVAWVLREVWSLRRISQDRSAGQGAA